MIDMAEIIQEQDEKLNDKQFTEVPQIDGIKIRMKGGHARVYETTLIKELLNTPEVLTTMKKIGILCENIGLTGTGFEAGNSITGAEIGTIGTASLAGSLVGCVIGVGIGYKIYSNSKKENEKFDQNYQKIDDINKTIYNVKETLLDNYLREYPNDANGITTLKAKEMAIKDFGIFKKLLTELDASIPSDINSNNYDKFIETLSDMHTRNIKLEKKPTTIAGNIGNVINAATQMLFSYNGCCPTNERDYNNKNDEKIKEMNNYLKGAVNQSQFIKRRGTNRISPIQDQNNENDNQQTGRLGSADNLEDRNNSMFSSDGINNINKNPQHQNQLLSDSYTQQNQQTNVNQINPRDQQQTYLQDFQQRKEINLQ
jgi:hypothetical protein